MNNYRWDFMIILTVLLGLLSVATVSNPHKIVRAKEPLPEQVVSIGKILLFEEGFRSKPYLDKEGFVTIGIGQLLHKKKGMNPDDFLITVTKEQAMYDTLADVEEIHSMLEVGSYSATYNKMSKVRQSALVLVAYQIGVQGLYKFKKTWAYLENKCYDEASAEMLDSLWAREQTPERAKRVSEVIRTGSWAEYGLLLQDNMEK